MDPNASKASPRKKNPHNNVQISTKSQIPIKVDVVKETLNPMVSEWSYDTDRNIGLGDKVKEMKGN